MTEESTPNSINWNSIEAALVRLTADNIAEFAAAHSGEAFYGFAFDCNADYGQAMPCLNTPEFHELAIDGKHLSPEITAGYEKVFGKSGPDTTPREERARQLKWGLGDWKYQDFSNQAYEDGWESFQALVTEATTPDFDDFEDHDAFDQHIAAIKETFLCTVCRAVIQLEMSGAFDCLNRTDDFRACVIDHDESQEDGWARLESVRRES